jgi:hypothetical protein
MTKRQQASIILAAGILIGVIVLVAFTHDGGYHTTWYSIVIFNPWTRHSFSFSFP